MALYFNPGLKKNKTVGPSNSKKSPSTSTEALKSTIEKKKQCSSKALEIVTRFSDGAVSESCLLQNLQFINQEHYQDIIEERAINKWCGYPLCSNQLKRVPGKRFHISTTYNKVFDITDRKNYCSNLCYKASKYLKDQISMSPVWLRENQPQTTYSFISLHSKCGIAGDEVDFGVKTIKLDDYTTNENAKSTETSPTSHVTGIILNESEICIQKSEFVDGNAEGQNVQGRLSDVCDEHNYSFKQFEGELLTDKSSPVQQAQIRGTARELMYNEKDISSNQFCKQVGLNQNESTVKTSNTIDQGNTFETPIQNKKSVNEKLVLDKDSNISLPINIMQTKLNNKISSMRDSKTYSVVSNKSTDVEGDVKRSKSASDKHNLPKHNNYSVQTLVMIVENVLREWFSIDSLFYIFGEERVKEMLEEKSDCISNYKSNTTSEESNLYERYLAICKKLNILELEDTAADIAFKDKIKKPLPNYETLKDEAKQMDLKVRRFYKGGTIVDFEDSAKFNDGSDNTDEPVLPLVDLYAQKSIRRRIAIDKLRKGLQDLQKTLGLMDFNLNEGVRTLLSTFTLSAHNITMKPAEWTLITIFMIKLLSIRNPILDKALNTDPTRKHLTLLLMSYSLDESYLDRLIVWLTDVESVLKNKS